MAITGYNTDIYPLDRMRGHLDGIIGSSDPVAIRAHLVAIQEDLNIVMENPNLLETTNEMVKLSPKIRFGYFLQTLQTSLEYKMM